MAIKITANLNRKWVDNVKPVWQIPDALHSACAGVVKTGDSAER